MTAEELWREYCGFARIPTDTPYEAWQFGGDPDGLLSLVMRGGKTATASAFDLYEAEGEPLPAAGDLSVILDSRDNARCVIRNTRVTVLPYADVGEDHAKKEGEGDRSLAYWRRVHEEFFTHELADAGLAFDENRRVVCEEFEVVYREGLILTETEHLRLRQYLPGDHDALRGIIGDAETMAFYPSPYDDTGVSNWLDWSYHNYADFGFGLWAVELKDSGKFIGDCGITMQIIEHRIRPEIGYHIHRSYWRHGYASEAARACRDWLFTHTPFQTVYSYMNAENIASIGVAKKNGMHCVGEYADREERLKIFAVSRQEWASARSLRQG